MTVLLIRLLPGKGPYKTFPNRILTFPDAHARTLVIEELDARLLQSLLDLRLRPSAVDHALWTPTIELLMA
jgi:hypothetical protein